MPSISRRSFIRQAAAVASSAAFPTLSRAIESTLPKVALNPTDFQIACMTLPYARFPLERALAGLKSAGYRYIAWGVTHKEENGERHVVDADAPPDRAKELAVRCRDLGLEPLMMFSEIYPENDKAIDVLTNRIKQASAACVPQVLTFGHTEGGKAAVWIERFKHLAPIAKDHNVTLVVKQHGGTTGTGEACASITREVNHPNVKVNYDAGNVMDYLNVDPIPDIKKCAAEVRSFCIKDHRNFPKDQDCGPGFGEIDHYKLLATIPDRGLTIPLCCENISTPLLPPPADPKGVDELAKRAREFLEVVIAGLKEKGKT